MATGWEVRTTGNDANGGGFLVGGTGTDFSQQDSPQVVYTDLVIGGTTTQLTSAAHPFNSTHVGNYINITGGAGFTTGWYRVVSVGGSTATMDRSVGVAASSGGTGNLGGGLLTPAQANTNSTSGDAIWIKFGTYNVTGALTPNNNVGPGIQGYDVTHGDQTLNRPTIKATGGSNYNIVNVTNNNFLLANVILDGNSTSGVRGLNMGGTQDAAYRVTMKNCPNYGCYTGQQNFLAGCYATNNSGGGISIDNGSVAFGCHCDAQASTVYGWEIRSNTTMVACLGTAQLNAAGFYVLTSQNNVRFINCTAAKNSGGSGEGFDGAVSASSLLFINCIMYGNGDYGFNFSGSAHANSFAFINTGLGGNTSGNRLPSGIGFILNDLALGVDPFTASATSAGGDYTLNNMAAGGGLLRNAGFPGAVPGEAISGSGMTAAGLDIGALQHFL